MMCKKPVPNARDVFSLKLISLVLGWLKSWLSSDIGGVNIHTVVVLVCRENACYGNKVEEGQAGASGAGGGGAG